MLGCKDIREKTEIFPQPEGMGVPLHSEGVQFSWLGVPRLLTELGLRFHSGGRGLRAPKRLPQKEGVEVEGAAAH